MPTFLNMQNHFRYNTKFNGKNDELDLKRGANRDVYVRSCGK